MSGMELHVEVAEDKVEKPHYVKRCNACNPTVDAVHSEVARRVPPAGGPAVIVKTNRRTQACVRVSVERDDIGRGHPLPRAE